VEPTAKTEHVEKLDPLLPQYEKGAPLSSRLLEKTTDATAALVRTASTEKAALGTFKTAKSTTLIPPKTKFRTD
jgi:hypothetical protein